MKDNKYTCIDTTFDYIKTVCDPEHVREVSDLVRISPHCQADIIGDLHCEHNGLAEVLESIEKDRFHYKRCDICPENDLNITVFADRDEYPGFNLFIANVIVNIEDRIDSCDDRARQICEEWWEEISGNVYDYREETKKNLIDRIKEEGCDSVEDLKKKFPFQKAVKDQLITGFVLNSYTDEFTAIKNVRGNWDLARKVVEKDYNRSFDDMVKYGCWKTIDVMIRQQMVREIYNESLEELF